MPKDYKYCCEGHDRVEICENDNVIRAVGSLRSKKGKKFKKISGPSKINGKDKIYIHELKKYKSCNKYNTLHEDEVYSEYTKQINNLKKDYPAMKKDDLLVLLEKHKGHAGNVKSEISKIKKKKEEEERQKYKNIQREREKERKESKKIYSGTRKKKKTKRSKKKTKRSKKKTKRSKINRKTKKRKTKKKTKRK